MERSFLPASNFLSRRSRNRASVLTEACRADSLVKNRLPSCLKPVVTTFPDQNRSSKPEIRTHDSNSKSESRNPKQIRNPKHQCSKQGTAPTRKIRDVSNLSIRSFEFVSSLGFRITNLPYALTPTLPYFHTAHTPSPVLPHAHRLLPVPTASALVRKDRQGLAQIRNRLMHLVHLSTVSNLPLLNIRICFDFRVSNFGFALRPYSHTPIHPYPHTPSPLHLCQRMLLARLFVPLRLHQLLLVLRRELGPIARVNRNGGWERSAPRG